MCRHAVLALRAAAYKLAIAAAGRELGDLERATTAKLLELMSLDECGLTTKHTSVPGPWLRALGLWALPLGPGALAGFFELWLCDAGAKLMGPEAEQRWLQAVRAGA